MTEEKKLQITKKLKKKIFEKYNLITRGHKFAGISPLFFVCLFFTKKQIYAALRRLLYVKNSCNTHKN